MAWALIVWRCSLVFSSVDKIVSVLIHLLPGETFFFFVLQIEKWQFHILLCILHWNRFQKKLFYFIFRFFCHLWGSVKWINNLVYSFALPEFPFYRSSYVVLFTCQAGFMWFRFCSLRNSLSEDWALGHIGIHFTMFFHEFG